MTVTIESICQRWQSAERPLFKGSLISDDGCCCAQGDVLRCSGYTDEQLRTMTQENADAEVARLLGISRTQAVLLRKVNDSKDGCPQDVLLHPERIVGDEWPEIDRFWRHLDTLTADRWDAARDAARAAARDAAWDAAWDAARAAAWDAAWDAAWATNEIQGRRTLKSLYFCKFFGFETTCGDGYTRSGRPE
jgi:hypothetical protein